MPGKIWTGTISFVLVSIPVEVVSAVQQSRVSFRMMHDEDYGLLHRRMFCPKDETFVHSEHIVNGYEISDNQYVVVREDEYKSLEPKRSQSIEIEAFVQPEQIDPVYFDRPYYLLPRKGGLKSYQMLADVLESSKKIGIARFVLHAREHLVAVRAKEGFLELITLHFHDQIRGTESIIPKLKAKSSDVKSITEQIKKLKGSYEPERYIDDYRKNLLEYLENKVKENQTVKVEQGEEEAEEGEEETQEDLVAALEESLAKVKNK